MAIAPAIGATLPYYFSDPALAIFALAGNPVCFFSSVQIAASTSLRSTPCSSIVRENENQRQRVDVG